jgi:hypothetical protein
VNLTGSGGAERFTRPRQREHVQLLAVGLRSVGLCPGETRLTRLAS